MVEYSGDLIDIVEAKVREELYAQNENAGCYMYYFKHNDIQYWWVDFFFLTNSILIEMI